jgi:putative DNA primase/helicase
VTQDQVPTRRPGPSRRAIQCLHFLLSASYGGGALAPEHRADLRASGLTDETVRLHRLRSVPPNMISQLLGFDPPVRSAMLIPFPDPRGGFLGHVRLKVFPSFQSRRGDTVKYLQPRWSGVRLFFALATLEDALAGAGPIWVVEGEKKALAVSQLGLPAVGFSGIEGWHLTGSRQLIPDFDCLPIRGRIFELVPDGDWRTNPAVERAGRFAEALEARGARVRLVVLPSGVTA